MSLAPRGGDVLAELVEHLVRAGGVLAGGRADLDEDLVFLGPPGEGRLCLRSQGFELLTNDAGHSNAPVYSYVLGLVARL